MATITSRGRALAAVKAQTDAFKKARATGRADITVCAVSPGMQLAIANIYGYTGGNANKKQLRKTKMLFDAVIPELDLLAGKFKIIVGDFNVDIQKLNACRELIAQGWVDLGASAEIWGKTK